MILPSLWGHGSVSRGIFGCHNWVVLLASGGRSQRCSSAPGNAQDSPTTENLRLKHQSMSGQRSSARDRPPLHSILCSSSDLHLLACFALAAGGATIAAMISTTQSTKIPNDSGEFHSLGPLPCPGTVITIQYLTQCNDKPMQ